MKINGSQLFFREIGGEFLKNNAFLVCGLIRLDNSEQIKDGIYYFETNDVLEEDK